MKIVIKKGFVLSGSVWNPGLYEVPNATGAEMIRLGKAEAAKVPEPVKKVEKEVTHGKSSSLDS